MGGTGSIINAFDSLMRRQGIHIELGKTVKSFLTKSDTVTGAVLDDGQEIYADLVVSNADPAYLYRHMIEPKKVSFTSWFKSNKPKFSMGLFVLYFGTTKKYPDVAHHTIWLGKRYQELLKDIFDRTTLSEDFSLYLHRPTATDPSFAPEGCDSFYVLCPVPNLLGHQVWSTEGPKLSERIIKALDRTILPHLKETITEDFYMTPQDFETNYLSEHGAGFYVAPLFTQSAWFRFHNRAEGLKNLYLVGAGTHPGAGLPGVLSSAKLVDSLLPNIERQFI
jgi:phytoene desaturase